MVSRSAGKVLTQQANAARSLPVNLEPDRRVGADTAGMEQVAVS